MVKPIAIIGVLPPNFSQPTGTDVYLPFDLPQEMWTAIVGARQLNTYARLAPGVTVAAADEELRVFARHATEAQPNNKDWGWRVQPLRENLLSGADNALLFVQAGAVVLLVLAISNLASLLMAWAAERQRETAVRLALGASGWRLVRQFLVQSVALVAVGGGLPAFFSRGSRCRRCSTSTPIPVSRFISSIWNSTAARCCSPRRSWPAPA